MLWAMTCYWVGAGSTMNLLMDIGICGTLCKELGLELRCARTAACNAVRGAHRGCVPRGPRSC